MLHGSPERLGRAAACLLGSRTLSGMTRDEIEVRQVRGGGIVIADCWEGQVGFQDRLKGCCRRCRVQAEI